MLRIFRKKNYLSIAIIFIFGLMLSASPCFGGKFAHRSKKLVKQPGKGGLKKPGAGTRAGQNIGNAMNSLKQARADRRAAKLDNANIRATQANTRLTQTNTRLTRAQVRQTRAATAATRSESRARVNAMRQQTAAVKQQTDAARRTAKQQTAAARRTAKQQANDAVFRKRVRSTSSAAPVGASPAKRVAVKSRQAVNAANRGAQTTARGAQKGVTRADLATRVMDSSHIRPTARSTAPATAGASVQPGRRAVFPRPQPVAAPVAKRTRPTALATAGASAQPGRRAIRPAPQSVASATASGAPVAKRARTVAPAPTNTAAARRPTRWSAR